MKKYTFLIAYDIADKKRLQKIAKIMEKNALRIQFSIFVLLDTTKEDLHLLLSKILEINNEKEDDIRVYKLKNSGISLGSATNLSDPLSF